MSLVCDFNGQELPEVQEADEFRLSEAENNELADLLKTVSAPVTAVLTTDAEEASLDPFDFSDLEALLTDSITTTLKKAEVIRARKALKRGQVSGEARAELQAIVAKWELEREWEAVGTDVIFEMQHCACGSVHHHFLGIFQRQKHRTSILLTRWIADKDSSYTTTQLPRGVKEEVTTVPLCIKCAVKQGWGVTL